LSVTRRDSAPAAAFINTVWPALSRSSIFSTPAVESRRISCVPLRPQMWTFSRPFVVSSRIFCQRVRSRSHATDVDLLAILPGFEPDELTREIG
jgi:hypothetical protein